MYRAKLDGINDVAVKILKSDLGAAHQASALQGFLAEIDIMRACRDTHIVGFLGAWANDVSAILWHACQ